MWLLEYQLTSRRMGLLIPEPHQFSVVAKRPNKSRVGHNLCKNKCMLFVFDSVLLQTAVPFVKTGNGN